jgi:hypothetical protein
MPETVETSQQQQVHQQGRQQHNMDATTHDFSSKSSQVSRTAKNL